MLAAHYPCEIEDLWLIQNYSIYGIREERGSWLKHASDALAHGKL